MSEIGKHCAFTNTVNLPSTECSPGLPYSNVKNQPVFLKKDAEKEAVFSPECVGEGRREVLIQRQVLQYRLELEPGDSWVRALWVRACSWSAGSVNTNLSKTPCSQSSCVVLNYR